MISSSCYLPAVWSKQMTWTELHFFLKTGTIVPTSLVSSNYIKQDNVSEETYNGLSKYGFHPNYRDSTNFCCNFCKMWWSISTPVFQVPLKSLHSPVIKTRKKKVSILNGSGMFQLLFSPGKKVERLEMSFQVSKSLNYRDLTLEPRAAFRVLASPWPHLSKWGHRDNGTGQVAPLDSVSWPHWWWVFLWETVNSILQPQLHCGLWRGQKL